MRGWVGHLRYVYCYLWKKNVLWCYCTCDSMWIATPSFRNLFAPSSWKRNWEPRGPRYPLSSRYYNKNGVSSPLHQCNIKTRKERKKLVGGNFIPSRRVIYASTLFSYSRKNRCVFLMRSRLLFLYVCYIIYSRARSLIFDGHLYIKRNI